MNATARLDPAFDIPFDRVGTVTRVYTATALPLCRSARRRRSVGSGVPGAASAAPTYIASAVAPSTPANFANVVSIADTSSGVRSDAGALPSSANSSKNASSPSAAGGKSGKHAVPYAVSPSAQRDAAHVALVNAPATHEVVPDTVYPSSHVGWHARPLARGFVQSPTPPFAGAADASQGSPTHVAATSVPAEHTEGPETVYPSLHVG